MPLELLRQLIVASDRVGQEFIMWYLKSAFDTYQKVQSSLQTRLTEMHSAALSPLQMMKNFIQSSAPEKNGESSQELEELRKRLSELEARQRKPLTKTRARKKTRQKKKAKS